MEQGMVERVARAIYAIQINYPANAEEWPFDQLPKTAHCWRMTRAAIEAMKEPTEAMQKAGFRANVIDNRGGCKGVPHGDNCIDWHDPDAIAAYMAQEGVCRIARVTSPADKPWRAMISTALSEPLP